jgi:hypothetical protein
LIRGDVDVVFRCGVKARLSPSAYGELVGAHSRCLLRLTSCSGDTAYLRYTDGKYLLSLA